MSNYDVVSNPAGWLGDKIGWSIKNNWPSIKQSAQALMVNNAKHFGSYGSDLPTSVLSPIIESEANGTGLSLPDILLSDSIDPVNPIKKAYKPSAVGISPVQKAEVDFINAELAKHYGMSASTAYQEALSNTSYQRAVKDMKAAGLNPAVMFGAGRAQGASSGIYASSASSGSGSGYRGRGNSSNDKLFSGSVYSAISAAVGLAAAVATKNPGNYWIGSQVAQGAMGLMDAVSKIK